MSAPPARRPVAADAVTLRRAEQRDCQCVWRLRNDPDTRRASFNSAHIPWDDHVQWFLDSLDRDDRAIFMIDVQGRSAGVVRLDIAGPDTAVSIQLASESRGRGVGPAALDKLAAVAFRDLGLVRLIASVKPDNARSLSAFASAGFTEILRTGDVVTLERRR